MKKVLLYTTSVCPYCIRAKELLKQYGASFEEIDVSDPHVRERMIERSSGRRTIPQIFIGDHHVGGFDDLYTLHKEGKLKILLEEEANA